MQSTASAEAPGSYLPALVEPARVRTADLVAAARQAVLRPDAAPELQTLGAVLNRVRESAAFDYARDIHALTAWSHGHGLDVFRLDRAAIESWVSDQVTEGAAPRTVARRLSAVQQFYLEAVDRGLVDRVPTLRVKRPTADEDQRLGIDLEGTRRLHAVAAASGPRDEALICLLLFNGLRASEVARLRVADYGSSRGHRTVRFARKRGKVRTHSLAPVTVAAVDAHLQERRAVRPEEPLVLALEGGPLSRHSVARATARLGRAAGLGPVNPHELRHSFVTLSRDAGADIRDVQEAAGHSSMDTTMGYDRARFALDRHPTYLLARHVLGGSE